MDMDQEAANNWRQPAIVRLRDLCLAVGASPVIPVLDSSNPTFPMAMRQESAGLVGPSRAGRGLGRGAGWAL